MPPPALDIHSAFAALNESAHRALRAAQAAGHNQADPLKMLVAYTDQLVDGAAPVAPAPLVGERAA